MAYTKFGNKLFKFGSSLLNSGESFVLKTVGATFPKGNGIMTLYFSSNAPVSVNYGDGSIIKYTPALVSLGVYRLNFSSSSNLYTYFDGLDKNREISFSLGRDKLTILELTNQQLQISDFLFEFSKYPALTSFKLTNEFYLLNLNVESIINSDVTIFYIGNSFVATSRLYSKIPIEIFTTPLVEFAVGCPGFNSVSFADSNMDKIYLLKNTLKSLILYNQFTNNHFGDGALPSNFNQLTLLEVIQLNNNGYTTTPAVLNQIITLKTLQLNNSTVYNSYGDISALTNLSSLVYSAVANVPTTFPTYFSGFTKLKLFDYRSSLTTITRVNAFIDSVYSLIVANAPITGANTLQFRGVSVIITGTNSSPSGTYQQPSGYIAGSSNGTPASQKEKIWVMVNQYGHSWITN